MLICMRSSWLSGVTWLSEEGETMSLVSVVEFTETPWLELRLLPWLEG